jgi:hypothetical protein
MDTLAQPAAPRLPTLEEIEQLQTAYRHLLRASGQAPQLYEQRTAAEAVPLAELRTQGVGNDFLLWMLFQAQIALAPRDGHAPPGSAGPSLTPSVLTSAASTLTLTDFGAAFAAWLLTQKPDRVLASGGAGPWGLLRLGRCLPRYDGNHRLFTWGRHILKCFRQPSANQEKILAKAETLQWPAWFGDPLPQRPKDKAKTRLHDTIKNLNRCQHAALVCFRGDGSGMRIGWSLR